MAELLHNIISLVHTGIVVAILGVIASFSPILYTTQAATLSKSSRAKANTIALMTGIVLALISLIVTFQLVQVNTLEAIISSTSKAIVVGVTTNVVIGVLFISGGTWYLVRRHSTLHPSPIKIKKGRNRSHPAFLVGLGFIRTFMTISGVGATYLAATAIADRGPHLLVQSILTVVFLLSALIPFGAIAFIMHRNRQYFTKIVHAARTLLWRLKYQKIIAIGAIVFGGTIVIINSLAVFM